jgi:hypothetical protein
VFAVDDPFVAAGAPAALLKLSTGAAPLGLNWLEGVGFEVEFPDPNPFVELAGGVELKEFVFCEVPFGARPVEFGMSLTELIFGLAAAFAS